MRTRRYRPAIALCSPALRARQTWALVRDALDCQATECMRPELYDAEPYTLLEAVRSVDSRYDSAIVVAHNPGIQGLAADLAGEGGNYRCVSYRLTRRVRYRELGGYSAGRRHSAGVRPAA